MAQTLVRLAGAGHGPANAVLLPHTARRLGHARGAEVAQQIVPQTGATRISELGVEHAALAECADAAAQRGELALTPPRATRDEILALYEAAW
jgi:alcohol dehydrogenase class IV